MTKKLLTSTLLLLALSGCINNQSTQTVQWDNITGGNYVASVSGIKSLMQPGFY